MDDDIRDVMAELFGGLESLLHSDEVMNTLEQIKLDEDVNAAQVLTHTATRMMDLKAKIEKG